MKSKFLKKHARKFITFHKFHKHSKKGRALTVNVFTNLNNAIISYFLTNLYAIIPVLFLEVFINILSKYICNACIIILARCDYKTIAYKYSVKVLI